MRDEQLLRDCGARDEWDRKNDAAYRPGMTPTCLACGGEIWVKPGGVRCLTCGITYTVNHGEGTWSKIP